MRDTVQNFSAIRDVSRMLEVFNCLPKVGRNIFEAVHEVEVEPWKKENRQSSTLLSPGTGIRYMKSMIDNMIADRTRWERSSIATTVFRSPT